MSESRDKIYACENIGDMESNYYTIITGDNASGKSSLLSKSVNAFLFVGKNENYLDPTIELTIDSADRPAKIIALCNSRFDKFTSTNVLNKSSKNRGLKYNAASYIHPTVDPNYRKGIASIVDSCIKNSLIKFHNKDNELSKNINEAMGMFGLQSHIHLKCTYDTKDIKYILEMFHYLSNGLAKLSNGCIVIGKKNTPLKSDLLNSRESSLDDAIEKMWVKIKDSELDNLIDILLMVDAEKIDEKYLDDIYYSISDRKIYSERKKIVFDIDNLNVITYLFILNVFSVVDFQVMHTNSQKEVSITSLSSGQQTLFGHAIVLSCHTEKNCLICIDEPENSLHPEWQLNFMRFFSLLFPINLESHILIATHSPQIISGMQFSNGCILSLESAMVNNKAQPKNRHKPQALNEYREQSADKQLTGIFKSPGHKNDFIIRKLVLILSKEARGLSLSIVDYNFIDEVKNLVNQDRIPDGDPVRLLLEQILSFQKVKK
ncbi:AAA family ATPase [Tatumella saanichensis]|uniref:AAA family ATPase n=1 Tax=Tatumella saanichensis TaxID=480813 RepID=UPI001F4C81BB|nr:AAA family ATPase [Tatumella saanichensis]